MSLFSSIPTRPASLASVCACIPVKFVGAVCGKGASVPIGSFRLDSVHCAGPMGGSEKLWHLIRLGNLSNDIHMGIRTEVFSKVDGTRCCETLMLNSNCFP